MWLVDSRGLLVKVKQQNVAIGFTWPASQGKTDNKMWLVDSRGLLVKARQQNVASGFLLSASQGKTTKCG
jgi:hypothetical protein